MGAPMAAAIRYAPDGFDVGRSGIMGRQSAGQSFLRAAIAARAGRAVIGYGVQQDRARFAKAVTALDAAAATRWFDLADLEHRFSGVCHRPDPALGSEAQLRLRAGVARYCLTGVTHTLSTPAVLSELAAMLIAPLAPWDALICTSKAAAETVRGLHEASSDYLRWRLGEAVRIGSPQTPVIPLGVHCADFNFSEAERREAREAMGIAAGDVLALFVGRRTFGAKAHPQAMFRGLQAAAERTGARVVLAECGEAPRAEIGQAHDIGAAQFAPDVRHLTPGGHPDTLRRCWAAADLFVSLADNVQETFGLTPLEAMAAGLPVVVSDWNGYRDTVRPGVDGFLIPTWAPAAGFGDWIAKGREVGALDDDRHNWAAASATSVDHLALVAALSALIENPALRRQMGEAGRGRARSVFDWSHVFGQYLALWGELNARRLAVADNPSELAWVEEAPSSSATRPDPFAAFSHYPTRAITTATVASAGPGASLEAYRATVGGGLWIALEIPEDKAAAVLAELAAGPATVAALALGIGASHADTVQIVATLAKMGLVRFG